MKKQSVSLLLGLLASSGAFAANVTISGTIPGTVILNPGVQSMAAGTFKLTPAPVVQQIQYERVVLSPEAKKYITEHAKSSDGKRRLMAMAATTNGVSQVQLGMGQVPPLNQGQHGTCATFATTAALDAALSRGDYISQLCNLELGAKLAQSNADYPSGWDGSNNELVLKQVGQYGAITKSYQTTYGCAGVKTYSLDASKTGRAMRVSDFKSHSLDVLKSISYKPLLTMDKAFSSAPENNDDTKLQAAKKALINGHRVIFGMVLNEDIGHNGTAGQYKVKFDSWVNTPEVGDADKLNAGHAMVITGFDDNAVITDVHGVKHSGVFTLRNSWGNAGDNGNYYMSYDYFTSYVMETEEIIPSA